MTHSTLRQPVADSDNDSSRKVEPGPRDAATDALFADPTFLTEIDRQSTATDVAFADPELTAGLRDTRTGVRQLIAYQPTPAEWEADQAQAASRQRNRPSVLATSVEELPEH